MRSETDRLKAIRDKVESGQRLSFDDGMALKRRTTYSHWARWRTWSRAVQRQLPYFNVNTHINPTNVCVYTCDFSARFGRTWAKTGPM